MYVEIFIRKTTETYLKSVKSERLIQSRASYRSIDEDKWRTLYEKYWHLTK